ncbi:MAG: hypothetical protein V1916_02395 [Patescibacteria group bacterium]
MKISLNTTMKVSLVSLAVVAVTVILGLFFRVDTRYFTYSEAQCRATVVREKVDWEAKYDHVNNMGAYDLYITFQSKYEGRDCRDYSSSENIEYAQWYAKVMGTEVGRLATQNDDGTINWSKVASYFDNYSNSIIIKSERDLCEGVHKLDEVADATVLKSCARPSFFKQ